MFSFGMAVIGNRLFSLNLLSFLSLFTLLMTEFRTDAAFSSISGTLIPTSEYLRLFDVSRDRHGNLLSVSQAQPVVSMKHHRIVLDPSVYPQDVRQFPVTLVGDFRTANGYIYQYQPSVQPLTPGGVPSNVTGTDPNDDSVTVVKFGTDFYVLDDEPINGVFVYLPLDNNGQYISNNQPPYYTLENLPDSGDTELTYSVTLPPGSFVGQQLTFVSPESDFTFSIENFTVDKVLILVWNGSAWKKIDLS